MNAVISFLLFLFRLLFGITFILSGVFKLVDPVGTGLIVSEYLSASHLLFLRPAAVFIGILLSITELVTGVAVLAQVRMRVFSRVALYLTAFFTVITFLLFEFNPIHDCGCFGEAIHLTNAQTFYKNLFLLAFIIPVFLWRNKYVPVSKALFEWCFLGFHVLFAVVLAAYSLATAPVVEFGDFKPGANIRNKLVPVPSDTLAADLYVYEKNGETKEFALDEIPDSTWNFVDVKSSSGMTEEPHAFEFSVYDAVGNDITDTIVGCEGPVFLFSVNDPSGLEEGEWREIVGTAIAVRDSSCRAYVLVPSVQMCDTSSVSDIIGVCDYRTLLSLYRSNGGVVYVYDALVVEKYCGGKYTVEDLKKLTDSDFDEIISKNCIRGNIFFELLLILVLLDMILFRYFSGIRYRKPSGGEKK